MNDNVSSNTSYLYFNNFMNKKYSIFVIKYAEKNLNFLIQTKSLTECYCQYYTLYLRCKSVEALYWAPNQEKICYGENKVSMSF